MPVQRAEVEVRFKTTADLSGVQQATASHRDHKLSIDEIVKALDKYEEAKARAIAQFQEEKQAHDRSLRTFQADFDEKKRATRVLDELKAAQESSAAATERATVSKRTFAGILKQLRHEIPGLNIAIHALKNPYFGIAAAAGLAIAKTRQFIGEVNRLSSAVHGDVFSKLGLGADKEFARDLEAQNKGLKKFFEEQAGAVNKWADALTTANEQLERQRRLSEGIEDATLKHDLAQIEERHGRGTPRAIMEATWAEGRARQRKKDREDKTELDAIDAMVPAILGADKTAKDKAAEAVAMDPKIKALQSEAEEAAQGVAQAISAAEAFGVTFGPEGQVGGKLGEKRAKMLRKIRDAEEAGDSTTATVERIRLRDLDAEIGGHAAGISGARDRRKQATQALEEAQAQKAGLIGQSQAAAQFATETRERYNTLGAGVPENRAARETVFGLETATATIQANQELAAAVQRVKDEILSTSKQINDLLTQVVQGQEVSKVEIEALRTRLKQLRSRLDNELD